MQTEEIVTRVNEYSSIYQIQKKIQVYKRNEKHQNDYFVYSMMPIKFLSWLNQTSQVGRVSYSVMQTFQNLLHLESFVKMPYDI